VIKGKEKNLGFVASENDETETKILKLKENMVGELEQVEKEHVEAVKELVDSYEESIRQA